MVFRRQREDPIVNPSDPTQGSTAPPRRGLLEEPTFGWGDETPNEPSLREILVEWIDAINFLKNRSRLLTALFSLFHLATLAALIYFVGWHFSLGKALIVGGIAMTIATVYNTVWYHRYCTHRAYQFQHLAWTRLFLWTNPVCFREESYVIPHHVHHARADKLGDPYGPHLGWLGSYLATESSAKTNLSINRSEYGRLSRGLKHIGIPLNSYEKFQRSGSVEKAGHWVARALFANLLWASLAFLLGGGVGVLVWYSGVFVYTYLVRDFNYRGHVGFPFWTSRGQAANKLFYGVVSGEWHENHHAHPRLAFSGFRWWQMDVPYLIIRTMKRCGIVSQVNTRKRTVPPRPQAEAA